MTLDYLHMANLCHRPRKCQQPTPEICLRLAWLWAREAKEASGASERGKAGARWKEMGGWCMAKMEQQQGSSWGGMSRVSSPQCQGVSCPRPPGWKELSDASAQMPTSHWTQTSPSPQHPICFPSFQNGTKGSQTKCREKVKEKWISSLPEERLIESKFSQKGNHG